MKTIKLFTFLLIFASPATSLASRVAKSFPIDSPTGWSSTNAACWAGLQRRISFVNLSDIPQTITIRMTNIELSYGSCDGASPTPAFGGNWVQDPISPSCWNTRDSITLPDYTQTFTLAANDSRTIGINAWCHVVRSGVTSCQLNGNPSNRVTDMNKNRVRVARSTLEFEVAQDRGALLANILAQPISHCGEFDNITRFNIPVNGGRPF